jgi:hypothetical protein
MTVPRDSAGSCTICEQYASLTDEVEAQISAAGTSADLNSKELAQLYAERRALRITFGVHQARPHAV